MSMSVVDLSFLAQKPISEIFRSFPFEVKVLTNDGHTVAVMGIARIGEEHFEVFVETTQMVKSVPKEFFEIGRETVDHWMKLYGTLIAHTNSECLRFVKMIGFEVAEEIQTSQGLVYKCKVESNGR